MHESIASSIHHYIDGNGMKTYRMFFCPHNTLVSELAHM